MKTTSYQSLLTIITCILFILNTQLSHAAMNNEDVVNKIFETHGKKNVVSFIFQKRDKNITIEKNKSFLNVSGRPDISLITAKSVIHDLKLLNIDISTLEIELDIFVENESKKKQEEDERLNKLSSISEEKKNVLSNKLKYQIQATQSKYNKETNTTERRRLKRELSSLQRAYKRAKDKEEAKLKVYFPENKSKRTKNSSYCESIKAKLTKLTESSYRHQIFFCNDRSYKAKNPKSCSGSRYGRQYTLQEYKDEISKLRLQASNNCAP